MVGPTARSTPSTAGRAAASTYDKKATTEDNAIDKTVEHREAAPGNVSSLHVGIVLDTRSLGASTPQDVQALVTSALGINAKRGDTVSVTTMPFDRTAGEGRRRRPRRAPRRPTPRRDQMLDDQDRRHRRA